MHADKFWQIMQQHPQVFYLLGLKGATVNTFITLMNEAASIVVLPWDQLDLGSHNLEGEQIIGDERKFGTLEYFLSRRFVSKEAFSQPLVRIDNMITVRLAIDKFLSDYQASKAVDAVVQIFTENIGAGSLQALANGVTGKQEMLRVQKYYNIYFMPSSTASSQG
jgi:hypothetical protein